MKRKRNERTKEDEREKFFCELARVNNCEGRKKFFRTHLIKDFGGGKEHLNSFFSI